MQFIRPVSDLRNKFTEIEKAVSGGTPVHLTKNGRGIMVVMSMEKYAQLLGEEYNDTVYSSKAVNENSPLYNNSTLQAETSNNIDNKNDRQIITLGFVKGIELPDSFYDSLPDGELELWGL